MARIAKSTKLYEQVKMGGEPAYVGRLTNMQLVQALNWYNHFHVVDDTTRGWVVDFMRDRKYSDADVKKYLSTPYNLTSMTMCSMARLLVRGAVFHNKLLEQRLRTILSSYVPKNHSTASERTNPYIDEFDSLLDRFFDNGYKGADDPASVHPEGTRLEIARAITYYTDLLAELTCSDAEEMYAKLNKRQLGRYRELVQSIVEVLRENKPARKQRVQRKPRVQRERKPSQVVRNVKFLASDPKTKATSIDPTKIVGAEIVFTYHARTRILTKYACKPGSTLSVKRSSIVGYDESLSGAKKLRVPDMALRVYATEGKMVCDKNFQKLSSKPAKLSPRLTSSTLIVRAFKG